VNPPASDVNALRAQLGNDLVDPLLFDGAQSLSGHAQTHETALALEPEALHMEVRQEASSTLVVRVGDAIPRHRALAGDLTDSGHSDSSGGRRAELTDGAQK